MLAVSWVIGKSSGKLQIIVELLFLECTVLNGVWLPLSKVAFLPKFFVSF